MIQPFLADSADLFTLLDPAVKTLAETAPPLTSVIETGIPALRDSPELNRQLASTAQALERFNDDDGVRSGLSRLTQTVGITKPLFRFITPAQTVCNYATILFRNFASATAQGANGGRWQRITVFEPPEGPNNEGSYADAPANGGGSDPDNYLHYNPYPNTAAPGQTFECEAGNAPYATGQQVIGNVPGNQGTVTSDQPGADTTDTGESQ